MKIDKKRITHRHGWRYLTAWGKYIYTHKTQGKCNIEKLSLFPAIFPVRQAQTKENRLRIIFSILEKKQRKKKKEKKAPESWNKWDLVSRWLLRYFTLRSLWYFRLVSKWLWVTIGTTQRPEGDENRYFKWKWSINLKIIDLEWAVISTEVVY